jgi:hypothetical protein
MLAYLAHEKNRENHLNFKEKVAVKVKVVVKEKAVVAQMQVQNNLIVI